MTQILIAVDDSDTSVVAARAAHRIFGDTAGYTVVNVAESGSMFWGGESLEYGIGYPLAFPGTVGALPYVVPGPALERSASGESDPVLAAEQVAADVADDAGLATAEIVGEQGDPVVAILDVADAHDAEVIVVGARNRSWLARLMSPSLTNAVLRKSSVPVLVVPESCLPYGDGG